MVDGSIVEEDDDGCQPEPQDIGDYPSPPRCQEGGALAALDDLYIIKSKFDNMMINAFPKIYMKNFTIFCDILICFDMKTKMDHQLHSEGIT